MGALKMLTRYLIVALCGTLIACSSPAPPAPPPPDAGFVVNEDLHLQWQSGLPLLPVTSTVPPSWKRAKTQWRTATTAFSFGAYEASSQQFMDLAQTLSASVGPAIDDTLRTARCMAYENAARAYPGAPNPQEGISALTQARLQDPGCRHSITRALAKLSAETGTTAPAQAPAAPERQQ